MDNHLNSRHYHPQTPSSRHNSLMRAELVTARLWDLLVLRFPWLVLGVGGGIVASLLVSKFELTLRANVSLAFFIPIIAYMSDAIGTQTETIFIRALTNLEFSITRYIFRELLVGALLGSVFGVITGVAATLISGFSNIGLVVGISLFLSMSLATVLACMTPILLRFMKIDPAVGSGPFTTALQDIVSLVLYFWVASMIL